MAPVGRLAVLPIGDPVQSVPFAHYPDLSSFAVGGRVLALSRLPNLRKGDADLGTNGRTVGLEHNKRLRDGADRGIEGQEPAPLKLAQGRLPHIGLSVLLQWVDGGDLEQGLVALANVFAAARRIEQKLDRHVLSVSARERHLGEVAPDARPLDPLEPSNDLELRGVKVADHGLVHIQSARGVDLDDRRFLHLGCIWHYLLLALFSASGPICVRAQWPACA